MTKRVVLSIVAAGVLLLAFAGSASANGTARYGWILQLRNTVHDVPAEDMSYRAFTAQTKVEDGRYNRTYVDDNKTPEDPSDDLTYTGLTLKRLVARIDGGSPTTLNKARAVAGYAVVVEAMDGFSAVYTSEEILTIGTRIIVADRLNGAVLYTPAAELEDNGDGTFSASWKPLWPLKVVSGNAAITGKRKPGGALRISIVPAPV